ncbi:MAG: hypothetical protein WBW88_04125, partial [Rhodothermales bacterium]
MPVPHSYDNLTIPSTGPDEVSTDSNPAISNVESKFAAVSDQASHLKIRDGARQDAGAHPRQRRDVDRQRVTRLRVIPK